MDEYCFSTQYFESIIDCCTESTLNEIKESTKTWNPEISQKAQLELLKRHPMKQNIEFEALEHDSGETIAFRDSPKKL